MSANKTRTPNGVRPNQVTGKAARKGIWLNKPDPPAYDLATLRIRQAETVKRTYTSVVNVPILKYTSATPEELQEKKEKISGEKKFSSKKMEKRIKRFCRAYRLPNPEHNSHSTIPKEAPWLSSRTDASDHAHIIHAAVPGGKGEDDTIPLNLAQCHYFYSDTGIASWQVARTIDGEIAKLKASTNNTSFREYAWRLSYLVCQGKREMRLMARDKNEKCGPLPLFSEHSLVKQLEFEMPQEKDAYKHEGVPISRAVRMMFQTADMDAFAKLSAVKKGIPCGTPKQPQKTISVEDINIEMEEDSEPEYESDDAIGLKVTGAELGISKGKMEEEEQELEKAEEPEPEQKDGDDNSNNDQEEAEQQGMGQEPEVEQHTPDPETFPSPDIPESPVTPEPRTSSPSGKAKKVNSKCGCCAFL